MASSYSSDIHIHLAGLNGIRLPDVTPSDYYFPQQWGLSKIKCPQAWRHTNGSPKIIIQIIDGGTDYGHPDLVHNIWQNLGQCPYGEDADGDGHTIEWDPAQNRWVLDPGDLEGYDDDYNGYVDDLVGWDFMNSDPDPDVDDPDPEWRDHGDKTAGTAAAETDNRISLDEATWICDNDTNSVAGTSWFSKIMIARFSGEDVLAIRAISYARNKGAKIISMSWSNPYDYPPLHAVLDSAFNEGILLIASAGNQASEAPRYPAAYENVIAVAGTESNDVKAANSNYGTWVDICAPYRNVAADRSNRWWELYCYDFWFSGTSASAPFVAGVAAMVWSCNLNATNAEVREAVITTADNIYWIPENYPYIGKLGSGRVNAYEAVKEFRPVPPPPGDCNADGIIDLADLLYLTSYLYKGGFPPDPWCVGDVTDDGVIDMADQLYLVSYLYKGGPPPLDGCD